MALNISGETLDTLPPPTAPVDFGSQQITNLTDPTSAQDGATKNYVDTTADTQIDSYITNQSATSWTKPARARLVEIYCIGSGASGAGGRSAATAMGGGGGGGGGWAYVADIAANFDSTLKVTVGAGGAQTSQSANGVSGNDGNPSFVTNNAASITYVEAKGGTKGDVGNNTTRGGAGGSSGPNAVPQNDSNFGVNGFGYGLRGAGAVATSNSFGNCALGSGGGGGSGASVITNTEGGHAVFGGGGGGGGGTSAKSVGGSGGGAAPLTASTAQGDAGINVAGLYIRGGSGGSGGGSTVHDGGAGGAPGGGGGGGGATATSGKGGAGADGAVVIITHF